MKHIFLFLLVLLCFNAGLAQNEILTNTEVVEMTRAGLSRDIIIEKINSSVGRFDTTTKALIELKKANVDDEVIRVILERSRITGEKPLNDGIKAAKLAEVKNNADQKTVFSPAEALASARTIALKKNSLHPSLPALEKELLNRAEWRDFNLTITANEQPADLYVQINFVHLSVITHRYTYRIYDSRSGTVIAAGETTSWGSLSENLAKKIIKSLAQIKKSAK